MRATTAATTEHLIRYGGEFTDLVIERADGSWLTAEDGRRILDFTSGQMCATLGHGHPAILDAMQEAAGRVVHLFSGFLSRDVIELARELMAVLPAPLALERVRHRRPALRGGEHQGRERHESPSSHDLRTIGPPGT